LHARCNVRAPPGRAVRRGVHGCADSAAGADARRAQWHERRTAAGTLRATQTAEMNAMGRWIVLALLLAAALAQPAQAQWKWRDKSGHTQYSDLPPPADVSESDILSRPHPTSRRVAAPAPAAASAASAPAVNAIVKPNTEDPALEAKRKQLEAEQAAKRKADEAKLAAAKADNCSRAKEQLRSIDSGVRLVRTNEKGEREVLDDDQRAQEAKRTRDIISADCK
jgi:hypothetical protein